MLVHTQDCLSWDEGPCGCDPMVIDDRCTRRHWLETSGCAQCMALEYARDDDEVEAVLMIFSNLDRVLLTGAQIEWLDHYIPAMGCSPRVALIEGRFSTLLARTEHYLDSAFS